MSIFLWGMGLYAVFMLILWARSTAAWPSVDRALAGQEERRIERKAKEDAERAIEAFCYICDADRTFLECRLTSRESMSIWIPDLRFCMECGVVMHIQESRVPE